MNRLVLLLLCSCALFSNVQLAQAQDEEAATPPATQAEEPSHKSPALAAGLALLFPGAGHYYLGEYGNGAWFTAAVPAVIGTGLLLDYKTGSNNLGKHWLVTMGMNLHFYQIFDAYRDARVMMNNKGYDYPIDRHDYVDLLVSPVNPEVMFRWETLIPTVVMVAGLNVLRYNGSPHGHPPGSALREDNIFGEPVDSRAAFVAGTFAHVPKNVHVGIGEEGLFRGVVQSGLTEWWGPYWGIPVHSVIFSLFHFPSYGSDPLAYFQAFLAGVIFGWQYHYTQDLRVSTAMHFWIDFSLSITDFVMDPKKNPIGLEIQFPF